MFHSHIVICDNFRPLQDWVILAPEKGEEIVEGIHVPDPARQFGRCPVVAVGPDCTLTTKDAVWIQKFVEGELKFSLNGRTVYAIRERHINCATLGEGLRAVGDRVLVKRIEPGEQIRGGILIPQSAAEKTQECEVVSIGTKGPFTVGAGDTILIGKYSGAEVRRGDQKLTIINESDIVGVIRKAQEKGPAAKPGRKSRLVA